VNFTLRGDHIALDALLKATGTAPSGGAAKVMVDAGSVMVDGVLESRRGRKVRAGQVVMVGDVRITVVAAPPAPPAGC
jgi:ribosome-associated protein